MKQTKQNNSPAVKTTIKNGVSYEGIKPAWVFDKIDRNGCFAFDINRDDFDYHEVLEKMISYANMTWGDLRRQTHDDGKSKHHFLDADKLSKNAKERLVAMHLEEEADQIYSIALQNKLRIVGLRVSDFLKWPAFDLTDCPSIAHFSVRQRFNDTGADAPVQSNHFSR